MGGVMTKLIEKNTTIPTKKTQVFSTAADSQTAVTIRVFQGEREQAAANKLLGQFDLANIPPAPRGVPQIEVSFDLDANGILSVSAKDLATNKEQKIIIKASSGLSEAEVERMVKDAEAHAEEDRKFQELITARNHADGLIHATEKAMHEAGDKVTADEKAKIEAAIATLKESIKTNDKQEIEKNTQMLTEASGKMAERMYAHAGQQHAEANPTTDGSGASAQNGKGTENVVDAEYEEVKKDKN
jgi:molecular chaperone DnaK